jgi:hypothetical protein
MARSIQSPGVEIREQDFTLRSASVEGTTVFFAGFADQGPIDEVLQPTTIGEFEQIYGTPTNAAEQYFYQTAKALLNTSPARLLVTRLPYGNERGEGFASWRYSALAYPVRSWEFTPTSVSPAVRQRNIFSITDTSGRPTGLNAFSNLSVLSGLAIGLCNTGTGAGSASQVVFEIYNDQGRNMPPTSGYLVGYNRVIVVSLTANTSTNTAGEIGAQVADFFNSDSWLSNWFNFSYEAGNYELTFDIENKVSGGTDVGSAVSYSTGVNAVSTLTINAIDLTRGVDAVTSSLGGSQNVTSSKGLSGGNVYFFGEPTYIELTQEEYNLLVTDNVSWDNRPSNVTNATPFTFANIGQAGLVIVNKAQTSINDMFEGYYVGIIDNNNYNPATPYNGIRNVDGIQGNSRGTNTFITIPSTRLNFSLSATSNGDGTSISEVMENLTQYDLDSESFNDTITIGLFRLRKSIYTRNTATLDYSLAEKHVGSLDYHRSIQDQNGGPQNPFFISEVADSSSNIKVIVNPWLSNKYSNSWTGDSGVPSKKVRFLSTQLQTPFVVPGFVDNATTYITRVGAASGDVASLASTMGRTEALYPVGVYTNTRTSAVDKNIGQLPLKLERAIELVENADIYPINLVCEAGLGTIFVNSLAQTDPQANVEYLSAGPFIDSLPMTGLSGLYTTNPDNLTDAGTLIRSNYMGVANPLIAFAEDRRKDLLVVLDPIRNIFVQGSNTKIINTKKTFGPNAGVGQNPSDAGFTTTNFTQHIYWPLRHQFGAINSSYATTYANVAQVLDTRTNRQIWVPFSGFAAAAMANTDFNFNPWQAPAGFKRGVITGINDLGVYPRQAQRDQLYKSAINPVTFFPGEGFVIFGQKTSLKTPSAFDRINVRRLFLYLETIVKNTMKYFVFEPNTLFTRTQVINTLTPVFDNAKNNEGVYDYLIVCDERNNTPDVIDNNELKVDIYLKPVRTAEFILVTFYATRTSQNFQELVGR